MKYKFEIGDVVDLATTNNVYSFYVIGLGDGFTRYARLGEKAVIVQDRVGYFRDKIKLLWACGGHSLVTEYELAGYFKRI